MSRMPKCPECQSSSNVKKIVYGMPMRMPTEEDNWVSGGCSIIMIIDENGKTVNANPTHACTECGVEF